MSRGSGALLVSHSVGFLLCCVCAQTDAPHRESNDTNATGSISFESLRTFWRSKDICYQQHQTWLKVCVSCNEKQRQRSRLQCGQSLWFAVGSTRWSQLFYPIDQETLSGRCTSRINIIWSKERLNKRCGERTNSASRLLMGIALMLQLIIVIPVLQPLSLLYQLCVLVRVINCLKQEEPVLQSNWFITNIKLFLRTKNIYLPDDIGNAQGDSS